MTRHLADIGPLMVPKSGHVTIAKIENLHIGTRRKIHWFQKCLLFDLRRKVTKLSQKKNVSEQALVAFSARHSSRTKHRSRILSYSFDLQRRLSSWIDARRQYILLVFYCCRFLKSDITWIWVFFVYSRVAVRESCLVRSKMRHSVPYRAGRLTSLGMG